jgi:hypothetical protein
MTEAKRPKLPMSLAQIASLVFAHLKRTRQTTLIATADSVMATIGSEGSDTRAIQRRVYDILNVLSACHLIEKTRTELRLIPSDSKLTLKESQERDAKLQVLRDKKKLLALRLTLLVRFRALIRRNQSSERPLKAIQITAIFVGFRSLQNGSTDRSLDSRSLIISSQSQPQFYSPMDILSKLPLTKEEEVQIVKSLGFDPSLLETE